MNGIIALKITFLGVGHVYEYEMNGIIVLNLLYLGKVGTRRSSVFVQQRKGGVKLKPQGFCLI